MENTLYKKNRHSCYDLHYHLVVVTKYRHPVFRNEAAAARLKEVAEGLFDGWGCTIAAFSTDVDHVHIMFDAPPQIQPSKVANSFKGVTSRYLRKEFADYLAKFYWKPYFWSDSYFIGSVSEKSQAVVRQYIENQGH